MLKSDDFKLAIQSLVALGATASVLVKVVDLAKNSTADLETICALLKNDGPVAADIIRISNSAYYAPVTLHGNLQSAILSIGLRQVIRVVNISLARQIFARNLTSYGVSADEYWKESIATALLMEALAKRTGLNAEDAYTIGILHAIGRVLIDRIIQEQGFSMEWNGRQPIEEWERGVVGFDFAETGAMLLEQWNFPLATCDAIHWQLDPEKVVDPLSLLGALQFSRRLIARTGSDLENKEWQLADEDPYLRASGLTIPQLSEILTACHEDSLRIRQAAAVD